jgi:hypothetical protein
MKFMDLLAVVEDAVSALRHEAERRRLGRGVSRSA